MSDIELSVVTGTYNRLPFLKQMVDSVRDNMGIGVPYEIVLVDGGSTDGTIEWCNEQSDIVLIEQGELLGAIKAFNAGLHASHGRYCVVGNDDIVYLDDTLLQALSFMHDNPDVGVGCFYQDRDHKGVWDLSRMPAILDGRQISHLYGQVCIVPKWLGDAVGWWGTVEGIRTYGGDNNLSCFVLERGYRVTGIQCACISDLKADDMLRQINNELAIRNAKTRSGHPDSNAWGKHWTQRNGLCGPIISHTPYKPTPLKRKTRFLYLPVYEAGHPIQYSQKMGLRLALAKYGLVYEYDWLKAARDGGKAYMLNYLGDLIESWRPNVLITQIHTPDQDMFNAESVAAIRREFPGVTWINWNGDYHPEDLLSGPNIDMVRHFDLQCVVTTQVREEYTKHGVSWMYWQIGYEHSTAEPEPSTPVHDVVFLANGYSGARLRIGRMLRKLHGVTTGIYGAWGGGVMSNGYNLYNFDEGQKLYRAAKLSIGDNQWGDTATGFVSNRLFQAMVAGGAMLLHQRVPGLEDLLGFVDGKHYVMWNSLGDLQKKIHYWLEPTHAEEREKIAAAGRECILKYHSFDNRVMELMEVI